MMGDVQGCAEPMHRLLREVDFSPSRDTLYLLGDLVNRGPDSAAVLAWAAAQGDSVRALLGNHDLHLLAAAAGVRKPSRKDTLGTILTHPEREAWLQWLRQQPLARLEHGWLMVHAGVLPQWDEAKTIALSAELESASGRFDRDFLSEMYGDVPAQWSEGLCGMGRWRVIVNALTRLRFCTAEGVMEFQTKEAAEQAPEGYLPWFEVPGRASAGWPIAFGHWSTLGAVARTDVLPLDTGCVWGGRLTLARLAPGARSAAEVERISLPCPQAQMPG